MRKPLALTEHARFRMHLRRISRGAIEEALRHPMVHATDTLTGYSIAVGKGSYGGVSRLLTVIYEETEETLEIVSVHPIRMSQYRMRLQRGRWKVT
jgi:hypothetical protein